MIRRKRKDHRAAAEVVAALLRFQGFARCQECMAAQERAGFERSTFALWNLYKSHRMVKISRGLYGATDLT